MLEVYQTEQMLSTHTNRIKFSIPNMSMSERIQKKMRENNLRQKDLVDATGASKSTVSVWISGPNEPSSQMLVKLRKVLNCSLEWLVTGTGPENDGLSHRDDDKNEEHKPPEVPLISFVQAGDLCDAEDPYSVGNYERLVPVREAKVTKGMYALRVEGHSMTSPLGLPSFPEGMIIIVDPEMQANNGSFVIAKDGEGKATFKKLQYDGDQIFLVPLNPSYPPIHIKDHLYICGVIVEMYYPLS